MPDRQAGFNIKHNDNKIATKSCKAKNDFLIQLKLLNVIALEQRETDNISQLIT